MTTGNQSARKKIFEKTGDNTRTDEKQSTSDCQRSGYSKRAKSKNGEKVNNAY